MMFSHIPCPLRGHFWAPNVLISGPPLSFFWIPFWEAEVAKTQGNQRLCASIAPPKGTRSRLHSGTRLGVSSGSLPDPPNFLPSKLITLQTFPLQYLLPSKPFTLQTFYANDVFPYSVSSPGPFLGSKCAHFRSPFKLLLDPLLGGRSCKNTRKPKALRQYRPSERDSFPAPFWDPFGGQFWVPSGSSKLFTLQTYYPPNFSPPILITLQTFYPPNFLRQ
jgi:hypothetical protein